MQGRMCLAEVRSRISHAGRICLAEVLSRISCAWEDVFGGGACKDESCGEDVRVRKIYDGRV